MAISPMAPAPRPEERHDAERRRRHCANVFNRQVVIFVKSVNRAIELNKLLCECNFPSICIHGRMQQEERLEHYKAFKSCNKRILVATDLAARGIDVE
eukprot:9246378-Pyramimonas_sp.AAC.1